MIPMYEKMAYVGEKPYRTLYLLTTPGEASYDHFQDNGEDYAYRKGVYNLYHFHKNAQGVIGNGNAAQKLSGIRADMLKNSRKIRTKNRCMA